MFKRKKNVCVIGAGCSGLIAIKELLDEGHEVTCFEKYDQFGGMFYSSDIEGKPKAYDSTLLTISNYMMAFSCYPPSLKENRKFWTAKEYERYLLDFAQCFSLEEKIQYEMEVVSVSKTGNGNYTVEARSSYNNKISAYSFDAVAVCSGSHRIPRCIEISGKDKFEGDIYHSAFYKNAANFTGRHALCIGMGETGADVAHEIAQVTENCVLSLRRYQPVLERFPLDGPHTNDAYTSYALYSMPVKAQNLFIKKLFLLIKKYSKKNVDQIFADWNLKVSDYFNHFFTKNEIFFNSIADGKLSVNTSGIDYLGEDHVVFKDGHKEYIDMIMLNTGYIDKFTFIKDVEIDDMRKLYKHMIHPGLGSGIVFIGWARPAVGGIPACAEMQSRYFALLCSGKKTLPENKQLNKLIAKQANFENEMYFKSPDVRTLVHYSSYMNDFSKIIGCSPWRFLTFLNPLLGYRLWFGSQMPCVYRLYGPHSDLKQARKVIFNVPIAFNLISSIILTVYGMGAWLLTALRLIEPDPEY